MERPGVAGAGGDDLQSIPERIPTVAPSIVAHFDLTSEENGRLPAILSGCGYVRFAHSCCSCSECLRPLSAMNFAVHCEHDRQLFAFEDEFDRLSDIRYQDDDDDDDDDDNNEEGAYELSGSGAQLAWGSFGANGRRDVDERIPNPLDALIFSFPTHLEKQLMATSEDRTNTMDSILTTTDNDSGIGRTTDESVRAEDSNCSEQEMAENFQRPVWLSYRNAGALSESPSVSKFPIRRCSGLLGQSREDDEEFDAVNQSLQQMQLLRNSMTDCCVSNGELLSFCNKVGKLSVCSQQRIVPRMGTRRSLFRTNQMLSPIPQEQSYSPVNEPSAAQSDDPVWIRQTDVWPNESYLRKATSIKRDDVLNAEKYFITGDYNACESGCNAPVTQHEAKTPRLGDEKTKPTDLLASSSSSSSKQMRIFEDNILTAKDPDNSKSLNALAQIGEEQDDKQSEDQPHSSLQQLYSQYVDVMYTNRRNLEHTIMVQQKLFEQQIRLNSQNKQMNSKPDLEIHQTAQATGNWNDSHAAHSSSSSSGLPMEWVLKRRSDGSRYVTRRPIRRQILKERALQLAEERCGITTDDDSKSELKLGRYWSRDKRKLHLEEARNHRQQKELIQKCRMETVRENGDQPTIIELGKRKAMRHKNKRIMDNFVTVQEMLVHGSQDPFGHKSNPLLSVTTV